MIDDLKPYPAMKDSGVEWLGEVPEHWDVRRGKYVFHCIDERSMTGEEELLTVSSANGVIPRRSTSVTMFKAESYVGHKLCWPDDLVINSLWAWGRGLGFADHHGIVSTAYGVYRLRSLTEASPRYLHRLVRSTPFHWELRVRSKGIWISRLQLTDESFLGSELPIPPLPEQAAIVRYLDHVDRRVRRLTRAKRKLIALLTEQKQAIIHRAVTRGLDPDVPLKDSGVEWLGEVPEHWEVVRSGHVINLLTGFPFKSEGFSKFEEDIRLLRGVNVTPGSLRWEDVVRWPSQQREELEAFQLETEDIILGMDRPIIAAGIRVTQVAHHDLPCLLVQRVARIRPRPGTDARFLLLLYAGKGFSDYLSPIFTGVSVPHLSPEQICSFRIAMPPIEEQEAIVEHLHGATENIDTTIARAEREIELLNEYRTRLIADVVTGKLDVRDAAAALPEVDPLAAEEDVEEDDQHSEENEVLLDPSDEEALA